MKFFAVLAALSAPLLALAQTDGSTFGPNYFTLDSNFTATAGKPAQLTWHPTTGGTVTLILRSGASSDLAPGHEIQSGVPNSGSYTWNVPADVTREAHYTLEIVSDSDPTVTNYSAYFVIDGTQTVAQSTFFSSTVPSATASGSSSGITSLSTTGTSVIVVTGTAKTSTSGTGTSSTGTRTTTSSVSSSTSPGAAPRATVMAGMLGMVALGALAL